jgi:hypothetical protein
LLHAPDLVSREIVMSNLKSKSNALTRTKADEFVSACPSRVIEMALENLEAVEKLSTYVVNMDSLGMMPRAMACAKFSSLEP